MAAFSTSSINTERNFTHNFASRQNQDPDATKDKDKEKDKDKNKKTSTDYQAAVEARKFIEDNEKDLPGGKLSYQNIWEGASSGNIGGDGKLIKLTDKQRAAFEKLAADDFALFNRLSVDNQLSSTSIGDGIRDSRKLHGSQKSDDDYWTDPVANVTGADAKKSLSGYFSEQFGDDWKQVSLKTVSQIANNGRYYDADKKNWVHVDDPKIIEAAAWLTRNGGDVDKGGANSLGWLSRSEFDSWNDV